MKSRQKTLGLILSIGLLACFFAPWSKFFGLPGSGFELARSPKIDGEPLFVLPALCSIVILMSFLSWNNRWLQILTGLTPILAAVAGLFFASKEMEVEISDLLPIIRPFMDWGIYGTLGVGVLLFLNGVIGRKRLE